MRARADSEVREAENVCPIPWHWVVPAWQAIAVMKTVLDRWLHCYVPGCLFPSGGQPGHLHAGEEGRACMGPVLLLLVSPVGALDY